MNYGTSNHVGSISVTGSARMQVGNNTTNNYYNDKDKDALAALSLTDPREDKIRIEETKGGLLKDSYCWVLHNPEFLRWCDPNENCPLLWIRGDPGKGKTMLLSGIINELEPRTRLGNPGSDISLSYFFCQATNSGLNNSTAVLRGLAYLLVEQQPCLLSHARNKASLSPEHLNSRVAISGILSEILRDSTLQNVIFVVDALDECITDLEFLLDFIKSTTSTKTKVRWLVSSRNIGDIEQHLKRAQTNTALSLELNAQSVSLAVRTYVQHQVGQLGSKMKTDELKSTESYLHANANGTFLWVALVCQRLSRSKRWEVAKLLRDFPPGLNRLYERMMDRVSESLSKDLYKRILAIVTTVHRPITFAELVAIEGLSDEDEVSEMIMECGCFLTSRDEVIYLVHQSAQDFLARQQDILFPSGLPRYYLSLFYKALKTLDILKMDIYGQVHPAVSVNNALCNRPEPDPLSGLAYFCQFWAHHLRDSQAICDQDPSHYNKAHQFMANKFLFWLEALSGGEAMALVEDARQFFLCFGSTIEEYPLQTYASGLLFSPEESLMRRHFEHCSPKFVVKKPRVDAQWPPYFSIPASADEIRFSEDNKSLVTLSFGELTKWKVSDGMESTRVYCDDLRFETLSPGLNWLAAVTSSFQSRDVEAYFALQVRSLESSSVKWSRKLDDHRVKCLKFSPDSQWLAVCFDKELVLWEVEKDNCKRWLLEIPQMYSHEIEFSSDGTLVAIFGRESTRSGSIVVLDIRTGEQHNPNPEINDVCSAIFLPDAHEIMVCSRDNVWSWGIAKGKSQVWLRLDHVASRIVSSHDASWIAVAWDLTVSVYGKQGKELLHQFELPSSPVLCIDLMAISFDNQRLAVGDTDSVWLWDISSSMSTQPHSDRVPVKEMFVSDNGNLMAWVLEQKIQVLNATTGSYLFESDMPWCWNSSQSMEPSFADNLAAFSPEGHLLVTSSSSSSSSSLLLIWDLTGQRLFHEKEVPDSIRKLAVSHGGSDCGQLVAAITTRNIYVWDAMTMKMRWSFEHTFPNHPTTLQFSDDKLAILWSLEDGYRLIFHHVTSGAQLTSFELPSYSDQKEHFHAFSVSPSGQRAAWKPSDSRLRIISISQEEGGIRSVSVAMNMLYEPNLSFLNDSTVLTNRGIFDIDAMMAEPAIGRTEPHEYIEELPTFHPDFIGYGCNDDSDWITLDGSPLLWLPVQYRPKSWQIKFATGERHFAMHCFSGVLCMQFSEDARDLL